MRRRRALEWTGFAIGAVLFAFIGVCGAIVLAVGEPRPPMLGNTDANIAHASLRGDDYRFAVLGDSQKGVTGLRRLLERLRAETPAFLVHTGDLVSSNDRGHYRLARWTALKARLDAPLLVVPGNHDIKGGSHLFESQLGPREFEFAHGHLRFFTIDDALGPPDTEHLEHRLRAAGDAPIVMFMHVPPFNPAKETLEPTPGFDPLLRLVRKYRVRYVLCGHAHTYRRIEDGGTVYIANGVGGDYDSWQLDQKVCATFVEVAGREIRDRAITLDAQHSLWDNIEHAALGHVSEAYRRQPVWCWGGTALLLAGWIALAVSLWRRPAPSQITNHKSQIEGTPET